MLSHFSTMYHAVVCSHHKIMRQSLDSCKADWKWKACKVNTTSDIKNKNKWHSPFCQFWTYEAFLWRSKIGKLRECSGSFEDVSSNTVICFWGIPQEFRRKMIVLLDTSDKDPLHSHCYQVNDCQKNNFVNKRRLAFLYWKKMPSSF